MTDDDGYICRDINATDYASLTLYYYWRTDDGAEDTNNDDSNDSGFVEYKVGGACSDASGWNEIAEHDLFGDAGWTHEEKILSSSVNNSHFLLRFRNSMNANTEFFRLDQIAIAAELDVCPNDEGFQTNVNQCAPVLPPPPPDTPEPQPLPVNSCMLPDTEGGDTVTLGVSPEKPLQQIITDAGYTINANVDQTEDEVWDGAGNNVTLKITQLDAIAGKPSAFGYYTNGNPASFVALFEHNDHPDFAAPLYSSPVIVVLPSLDEISFAFSTHNGSSATLYSTVPGDNSFNTSEDHAAVYNPLSDEYIVAFEDLLFVDGDEDYNDMVVKIETECENQLVCDPEVNLITNRSFEEPALADNSWNIFENVPGWTINWVNPSGAPTPSLEFHRGIFGSSEGAQHIELDGDWYGPSNAGQGGSTKISQIVDTIPGKNYRLGFDFSGRPDTSLADNVLGVSWEGSPIAGSPIMATSTTWNGFSFLLPASGSSASLSFEDAGPQNSLGTFLDNVSLYCIEEEEDPCTEYDEVVVSGTDDQVDTHNAFETWTHPAWVATSTSAKWIWSDTLVQNPTEDEVKVFTKTFNVSGIPQSVMLSMASDNTAKVVINGNIVASTTVEANYAAFVDYVVDPSYLNMGLNTIEITVHNWKLDEGTSETNPAGVIYALYIDSKFCPGDENNNPEESTVFFKKYIVGSGEADYTGDSAPTFKLNITGAGNGDLLLNDDNNYEEDSEPIVSEYNNVTVYEVTEGEVGGENSNVLPYGAECAPGKYRFAGYGVGNNFVNASGAATTTSDLVLSSISSDTYVAVWNEVCPTNATIVAAKIVCTEEGDLPNWGEGDGVSPITSTTASDWVSAHSSCHFEDGWTFEWAPAGASNPGDSDIGVTGSPWTAFGPTNVFGTTTLSVTIPVVENPYIWIREVTQNGYLPFSGWLSGNESDPLDPQDEVSAEIYCNVDVLNYDNYDRVDNLIAGNTYYCVAWNVPTQTQQITDTDNGPDDGGPSVASSISDNGGGGGGGGLGGHRNFSFIGGGASEGDVLGATTDIPGLPNTGNAEKTTSVLQIILLSFLFLAIVNITASKSLKV